jgi:hypothetical protein
MTTLFIRKLYDTFVPVDEASMDAFERLKPNEVYKAEITKPRNIEYHKRFFALLNMAYKNYEQPEIFHNGIRVFRSFERFRSDVIISCGYWDLGLNKNNKVIQIAKSISFAKMEQVEFEELFSKAIDVILHEYLTYYDEEDMNKLVEQVLSFA